MPRHCCWTGWGRSRSPRFRTISTAGCWRAAGPCTRSPMPFDIAIVGGSFAGISAALPLARARRRVAVFDTGMRRNRFAAASHGFFAQDGKPPGDIVAEAKAQLLAYPTVRWIDAAVED